MYEDVVGYEGRFYALLYIDDLGFMGISHAFSKNEIHDFKREFVGLNVLEYEFENTPEIQDYFYGEVLIRLDELKGASREFDQRNEKLAILYPERFFEVAHDMLANFDQTLEV